MRLKNRILRGGIFFVIFVILHFLYDLIPHPAVGLVSGTSESVFQHLKIGFYAYLLAGLLELPLLPVRRIFFSPRNTYPWLFTAVLVPWFLFILYYLMPAIAGEVENMRYHVMYSTFITYVAGVFAAVVRDELAEAPLGRGLRLITLLLFISTAVLVVVFNVQPPPLDLFEMP
jgi:hypothetical protein